jgi:hypothetical protein
MHAKDESLPHRREQFLTVIGRLGLQPVSLHVETLFPAWVCVQRQTILAAAIFLQRRRRGISQFKLSLAQNSSAEIWRSFVFLQSARGLAQSKTLRVFQ